MVRNSTKSLILAGVAVSDLFSSLVSFIKYVVDVEKPPELVFWQMDSISDTTWPQILLLVSAAAGYNVTKPMVYVGGEAATHVKNMEQARWIAFANAYYTYCGADNLKLHAAKGKR